MVKNDRPVSERFLSGLIKARLYAAGVTQGEIAAAVGVTPALVSMVISGKRKNDRVMQAILEATDGVCESKRGPESEVSRPGPKNIC